MEEKKIPEDHLDNVSGGQNTNEKILKQTIKYQSQLEPLRAELEEKMPIGLSRKLADANDDVEICKLLAEHGVNVEKLQRKIPDEILDQIGGGYDNIFGTEIYCPHCDNKESSEISTQILSSIFSQSSKYRCRKCGGFFKLDATGRCIKIIN